MDEFESEESLKKIRYLRHHHHYCPINLRLLDIFTFQPLDQLHPQSLSVLSAYLRTPFPPLQNASPHQTPSRRPFKYPSSPQTKLKPLNYNNAQQQPPFITPSIPPPASLLANLPHRQTTQNHDFTPTHRSCLRFHHRQSPRFHFRPSSSSALSNSAAPHQEAFSCCYGPHARQCVRGRIRYL